MRGRGRELEDFTVLGPVHQLDAVVDDQIAALCALAESPVIVHLGQGCGELEDVVTLRQIERRAIGIGAAGIGHAPGVARRSEIPGQGKLVAVDLGEGHDPIHCGAAVAVRAVALVEVHPTAKVPGHAAEAQGAELAVHLAPDPLGTDGRSEGVLSGRRLRVGQDSGLCQVGAQIRL